MNPDGETFTNVAVYALCFANHIYIVGTGDDIHYVGKGTYITPAPWVFNIWAVIHFLLLGTVVFQFFPGGQASIIHGISWNLPFLGVLNLVYIHVWASGKHYVWAWILGILVSWTVGTIWLHGRPVDRPLPSLGEELFVNLPFALYYGWMAVLVWQNIFDAFGVEATERAGGWTKFFVFLFLSGMQGTTTSMGTTRVDIIDWSRFEPKVVHHFSGGDFYFGIPITVALWAVADQQRSSGFVHKCALVFAILATVGVVISSLMYMVTAGVILHALYYREPVADQERASEAWPSPRVLPAIPETEPLLG
ncbi:hypothetical protein BDZ89DRAFT_1082907 [Hymenopellis radicata]|nr:hypothetical protein BDZ89DRAFT_1082907 [Hymenopellis radicata]